MSYHSLNNTLMATSLWSCLFLFFLLFAAFLSCTAVEQMAVDATEEGGSSWVQWAMEKLGKGLEMKKDLAKKTISQAVDMEQDFSLETVSEAIDTLKRDGSCGSDDSGGGDDAHEGEHEKWDSWVEWGKVKIKDLMEKMSDATKDKLSGAVDATHRFIKTIFEEVESATKGKGKEDKEEGDEL